MTRYLMLWRHAFGEPRRRDERRARRRAAELETWQPAERVRWRDHLFE